MTFLLSLMLNAVPASSVQFQGCSEWKLESGVSCVFAGEMSKSWKRDCSGAQEEYQCRRGPGKLPPQEPCLAESMCFDHSPNQLEADCSPWVVEAGVSCADKPKLWRRACQWEALSVTACTVYEKTYPTEEDFDQ